ncbi:MAG: IS200/IS605 family element transposase accessory protein TnpB [Actinobacteria bacterium]|nr:IS200/IS605 family element transposase accessory protein TnpB [Actinomycetota bacterium]
MIISKGFKYKLRLTKEQESFCGQTAGSCRYVWNKGLALKKELWEKKKQKLSRFDLGKLLTQWKKGLDWLSLPPSQSLQQTNKDLDQAFSNFFHGRGYPKFKKKGIHDSFRLPQGITLMEQLSKKVGQAKLPKLGIVRFTKSKELEGRIKHVTISKTCGKWYIAFNCEVNRHVPKEIAQSKVGIDRGIKTFAQCSDGITIQGVSPLKKNLKKLAKLQRKLSKKKKFSSNWRKTKQKIEKLHYHISNVRKDFLHKTSTQLAKSHGLIVMEDLKVGNMSKSSKGTKENPGENVKAKSGLNRSILDQGWYTFQNLLSYKLDWRGGRLILISPKNTSLKCRICGHIAKENRVKLEEFQCVNCGHTENADLNASINILAEGHSVIACGVEAFASTVKQELLIRKPMAV